MNNIDQIKKIEELYNVFVAKIGLNGLTNAEASALLSSVFITIANKKETKEFLNENGIDVTKLNTAELLGLQAAWTTAYYRQNGGAEVIDEDGNVEDRVFSLVGEWETNMKFKNKEDADE